MGDRVVLHVGAMKSGTSFIQSALMHHQPQLAEHGVCFLGGAFGKQSRAVREILQPVGHTVRPRKVSRWQRLVDQAAAFDGHTSVVSMEFLSFAGPEQAARVLAPLGGLEVQVVLTARDQLRTVPAQWQTYTRNGGTDDWATYLDNIRATRLPTRTRTRAHKTFHRAQDLDRVLDVWGDRPEVTDLTVVTVPPPGAPRDELWRRFCEAVGIPAGVGDLEGLKENPSLGYASCDVMRRLNGHLEDVKAKPYRKAVRPLCREALVHLRAEEGRPPMSPEVIDFALERNATLRRAIQARASRVVGDLGDLPERAVEVTPAPVAPPEQEQVLRAARAAWDHAAGQVRKRRPQQARKLATAPRDPGSVDAVVAEVATLLRRAHKWGR